MSNELKAQVALGTLFPFSILFTSGKWFTFYTSDESERNVWSQALSNTAITISPVVIMGSVHLHRRNIEIHFLGFPLTQEKLDEESTNAPT